MYEKDKRIMRYVPKSKIEAISQAWIDDDGMWIILNEGWNADRMDNCCRTIHEEYVKDLRWQIAGITRLHYYLISKVDGNREEITFDEAIDKLATCYEERVTTLEQMLGCVQTIPLMFSNIEVKAE